MNLYDIVTPMTMDEAKATKQRLDAKCWKGYKKQGTKVKGGVRVNNCVPNESATAPIIVPKRRAKVKEPTEFNIPYSADDYVPPALELASVEALDRIIADPATKETTRELAKKAKSKKQGVEEDSWHAGDNAWSSENHEMVEADVDEGYQDFNKVEPYYVCIGGKPWKKFDYYEDARRAHDNLKKKWYKEGNPKYDTVTLMPVMDEAISKKDLLGKLAKDLNTPFKKAKAGKLKSNGKDFTKGDHWTGPDKDDPSYTRNFGHGYPDTPSNRSHDRYVNKSLKKDIDEAGSPAQQAAIAIAKKKEQGVAEMDKSQKGPAGWNLDDYDYTKGKWSQGKPVTAKKAVSDMTKDLDRAFNNTEPKNKKPVKESYWTKLQNERNTKLNSLVNELKESIKK